MSTRLRFLSCRLRDGAAAYITPLSFYIPVPIHMPSTMPVPVCRRVPMPVSIVHTYTCVHTRTTYAHSHKLPTCTCRAQHWCQATNDTPFPLLLSSREHLFITHVHTPLKSTVRHNASSPSAPPRGHTPQARLATAHLYPAPPRPYGDKMAGWPAG